MTQSPLRTPPAGLAELARWRPRVTHAGPVVDLEAAEQAAFDLLTALGLPVDDEAMLETPRRMAHACSMASP